MQPLTPRVKKAFLTSFRKKWPNFAYKLRCDVPFGRLQKCPQLPMTAARDQLHPTISKTRNALGLVRGAWVRLPPAPPITVQRSFLGRCAVFLYKITSKTSIYYHSFQMLRRELADFGENLPHFLDLNPFQGHSSWLLRRKSWRSNPDGNKYWQLWKNRCVQATPESVSSERHLPATGWHRNDAGREIELASDQSYGGSV